MNIHLDMVFIVPFLYILMVSCNYLNGEKLKNCIVNQLGNSNL